MALHDAADNAQHNDVVDAAFAVGEDNDTAAAIDAEAEAADVQERVTARADEMAESQVDVNRDDNELQALTELVFADEPEGAPEGTETPPETATPEAAPPADGLGELSPQHWSEADRKQFEKLPPEMQTYVLDRARNMEAAHTQRSQEVAPWRNAVAEHAPYMAEVGLTDPAQQAHAISKLVGFERTLRTGTTEEKLGVVNMILTEYGLVQGDGNGGFVPVGGEAQGGSPGPAPVDPQVQHQINALHQGQAQQAAANTAQHEARNAQIVQSFRTQTGPDGQPLHPHFGAVEQDMVRLAQGEIMSGRPNPDLNKLYAEACLINPGVAHLTQQAAKAESKARDAEKVKRAKAANGSITGYGVGEPAPGSSMDEVVEKAFANF